MLERILNIKCIKTKLYEYRKVLHVRLGNVSRLNIYIHVKIFKEMYLEKKNKKK